MAQIIRFPQQPGTANKIFETEEERLENVRRYQLQFVLNHSIEIAYGVYDQMEARGITLTSNDKIHMDMMMVLESIKAMMLRSCNIDHPLHVLTEDIVNQNDSSVLRDQWVNVINGEDDYE